MKNILLHRINAIVLLLSTISCHKFLEQSSQDLIRPVTVEHYKELLQGEGYFKNFYSNGWFVDLMTDDITAIDPLRGGATQNAIRAYAELPYQWAPNLEDPTGSFTDRLFQHLYKNIVTANSVLLAIDEMEGTDEDRTVLRGQALFTRAYGYFVLANLYAQAYNEAALNDLCVPIILNATPSLNRYNRATIQEVWSLISDDISAATTALSHDTESRSVYEINYRAALILATRVYLYLGLHDRAIEYGETYLGISPGLKDISNMTASPARTGASPLSTFLYHPENPEIAFVFSEMNCATCVGTAPYFSSSYISTTGPDVVFGVSYTGGASLLESYTGTDRRKNYWFAPPTGAIGASAVYITYTPYKYDYNNGIRYSQSLRTAEIYLNLAEAYARKDNPENARALDLLNLLRSNRIGDYTMLRPNDFPSQETLLAFIWEERRRELCFEEFHRWWDLRRTGQPAIRHEWLGRTYQLDAGDPAYLLNFPSEELEFNPDLVQNPRPQRPPITN